MRRLALLLTLFCSPGLADNCDRLPKPSVSLKLHEEPISLDTQTSIRTLTLLGPLPMRPGKHVLGLTRGTATVQFETRIASYVDPSGQWECASPQISVSYGFSPMTVYVAREFPEGSCAYREIHKHEMRHVRAYQTHLKHIEQSLADTLNERFASAGPWRGPRGQASARLQQELEARWVPYVKREINKVDAAQALIDTPEEYARVAGSCGGEIRKITR